MSRKSPVFLAVAVLLLVAFPVLAASSDPEIFASQSPDAQPSVLRLPAVQSPMQIAEAARQMQSLSPMLAESNDQSSGSGGLWVSRHKVLTVILIIAVGGGIYAASRGGYHKKSPGGGGNPGGGY